ncbi:MAG: hypothetical protein SGILL_001807 [Bacillariaceae sp.]
MKKEVVQELVTTQSMLRKTESHLKERDSKVVSLQRNLRSKEKELQDVITEKNILIREIERLNEDADELEYGSERPELEKRLRKAVELLRKDLAASQEKYAASKIEVKSHQSKVEFMEEKNEMLRQSMKKLEEKNKSSEEKLSQMTEAREEATKLTEEVAELRDRLRHSKMRADEKQAVIEQKISHQVKERLRVEVREETTKQVTERTERRIRAELQLAHDKEINALRAEFKKVFKEHSILQRQVDNSKNDVSKAERLEQQFPVLKEEIELLTEELEATKEESEQTIAELENQYRSQIQLVKEQAAKEKWDHGTEIRRHISKERDREVHDFTQRIEVLSKQTDRLLQRAEREKEEYADQVRKRISQEKQREIQDLSDKLAEITKESEDLLQEAGKDKEAYADQIRKQMTEEKTRELNKQSYRIEVLTSEKEALQKRIDAFEQELKWTWQQQEKNVEKIASTETALKSTEDELFSLKRSNQNLVNLVERYKKEHEDAAVDFKAAKDHFRESLLESEEAIFKLKDEIQNVEADLEASRNKHTSAVNKLNALRTSAGHGDGWDEDQPPLVVVPEDDVCSETSSVNTMLSAIESEKARLKNKRKAMRGYRGEDRLKESWREESKSSTGEYLHSGHLSHGISTRAVAFDTTGVHPESHEILTEQLRSTSAENIRLQHELKSASSDLLGKDGELAELRDALENNQSENIALKTKIEELTIALDGCKKELVRISNDPHSSKESTSVLQDYEERIRELEQHLDEAKISSNNQLATSVAMYSKEIDSLMERLQQANDRLESCQCANDNDTVSAQESNGLISGEEADTLDSNETERLDNEINNLKVMIQKHKMDYSDSEALDDEENEEESTHPEDVAQLVCQIDILKRTVDVSNDRQRDHLRQIQMLTETIESNREIIQDYESKEQDQAVYVAKMNKKVKELEQVIEGESIQASTELQAENIVLREKVQELEKLLNEYNERLSEATEELVETRQELASGGGSINHLRQRVDNLTRMLEEKDGTLNKMESMLEESNRKLDERTQQSKKEITELSSQMEELEYLLSQTQEELRESVDHETQSRDSLESKMVQSSNKSKQLQAQNQQLHQELERCEKEKSSILKELDHSKRLFGEAVTESEKTIFELSQRVESLSEALATSEIGLRDSIYDLETSNKELNDALEQSCGEYEEKVKDLQKLIDAMGTEKEILSNELGSVQQSMENATQELENEKAKSDKAIRKLRSEVTTCNEETLELSKELQHSRQLFREALIAWRVETKELTRQLDKFRGTDQWQSFHSRESVSLQSSQLVVPDSAHSRDSSSFKPDVERASREADTKRSSDDFDSDNDDVSYEELRTESPGKAKASKFFTNLMTEDRQGHVSGSMKNASTEKEQEVDESVSTAGSVSIPTNSSAGRKEVRWDDKHESQQIQRKLTISRAEMHGQEKTTIVREDSDRVTETRNIREDETTRDRPSDIIETRSLESATGESFSTEDQSLRGSRLLPRGDFPLQHNRFQSFRRNQQEQQLEQSESRDDTTVQSRDSGFFSYTYSETSNYSREYRAAGEQSETDNSSTRYRAQSHYNQTMQAHQRPSADQSEDAARQQQHDSTNRAWSPRFMQLLSKQKATGRDSMTTLPGGLLPSGSSHSASTRYGDKSASNRTMSSKPLPYDEQKEQAEEERPFDEAQRREMAAARTNERNANERQRDESGDGLSVSLAENSTVANSEIQSLTVDSSA